MITFYPLNFLIFFKKKKTFVKFDFFFFGSQSENRPTCCYRTSCAVVGNTIRIVNTVVRCFNVLTEIRERRFVSGRIVYS